MTVSGDAERWRQIVIDVVEQARKKAGSSDALTQQLEQVGVVGERGKRYSLSAVTNWVKGRSTPPADALLALAVIGGVSLDKHLNPDNNDDDDVAGRVEDLETEIERILKHLNL